MMELIVRYLLINRIMKVIKVDIQTEKIKHTSGNVVRVAKHDGLQAVAFDDDAYPVNFPMHDVETKEYIIRKLAIPFGGRYETRLVAVRDCDYELLVTLLYDGLCEVRDNLEWGRSCDRWYRLSWWRRLYLVFRPNKISFYI